MIEYKNGKAYCDGEVYVPYTPQNCACCDKCALYYKCDEFHRCVTSIGEGKLFKKEEPTTDLQLTNELIKLFTLNF